MKKKIALIALAFVCIACLFTLTACGGDDDPLDFVTEQGNTIAVYYDDMMGTDPTWWQIKPGSPLPEPGVTANVKKPERSGYVLIGYYQGTKDEATGEVTYGEKWDFSTKVNESVTLYAKWEKQYVIHINYVLDGQLVEQDDRVNVFGNVSQVTSIKEPSFIGNTFVEMYSDLAMTNPLKVSTATPFVHGCTQENPVVEVYAKFVTGRWTIVRTANDMRSISAGSRLYLLNDIDFAELNDAETGLTNITINRGIFTGAIEGNGYTIKNLHYSAKGEKGATHAGRNNFGLFSKVQGASFTNIVFENCSVVGTVESESDEYFYGFLAGTAQDTADKKNVFSNITLKNCQVKPLQFNTTTFTPDQIAQQQSRIDQKLFIAAGTDFVPTVVND